MPKKVSSEVENVVDTLLSMLHDVISDELDDTSNKGHTCSNCSMCNEQEDFIPPSNVTGTVKVALSKEDSQALSFASAYMADALDGKDLSGYRKFFIDEVLPKPNLKDIFKYLR